MVRVIIKGGVWKNTEDEILKAAIQKYGKNQWSRIASLLHRKSAKQCKARWYEWLDPRIKKTEWSREEDEKLLHLAKIMPTQWRTIAPIVGRTAAQCLERYEHLLDEAQRRAEGIDEAADTLKEAKKLRPGDVDPTPETKPARPDPVDMDEDELEMLSEARARLANTQGKKAKRKAREKQLSEARRLASLQKRRELRAAGIMAGGGGMGWRFRKSGRIDYNAEIPFEKPTPAGFHDPTDDQSINKNAKKARAPEKRRDEKEIEERRKDKQKLKKRNAEDDPQSVFAEKHEKKRSKLLLPEPQISDKELDEIIKIGHASDSVRELADDNPTSTLLHDYTESAKNLTAARTLKTPAYAADSIAKAADDLLALTNAETPLKGGINTPLHSTDFRAPGQQGQMTATPNTVLTALMATPKSNAAFDGRMFVIRGGDLACSQINSNTPSSETPRSVVSATTPGSTPFRDQLNINQEAGDILEGVSTKDLLRKQFQSLPMPRNDFELVLPDGEDESAEKLDGEDWVEDAGEMDSRRRALAEKRAAEERLKRSRPMQRSLPIPSKVNEHYNKTSSAKTPLALADELIKEEMMVLMSWDADGREPPGGRNEFTVDQLQEARGIIQDELHKVGEDVELDATMWQVIDTCSSEMIRHQGRFLRLSNLSKKEQIDALTGEFKLHHDWMQQQSKATGKVEKKLKVTLGGYAVREQQFQTRIAEARKERDRLATELKTFQRLEANEEKAIVRRTQVLEEELKQQEQREKELQKLYSDLQHRRWELEQVEIREKATTSSAPLSYHE